MQESSKYVIDSIKFIRSLFWKKKQQLWKPILREQNVLIQFSKIQEVDCKKSIYMSITDTLKR